MTDIEGTADEIGMDLVPADTPAPPSTLFRTDDPVEVLEKASRVADALRDVIAQKQLFKRIGDKDHVLVEGWSTCGAMLGLTAYCVWSRPLGDRGEHGHDWEARVEVRTLDGRTIGAAEAMCTRKERTWAKRDDYALRSMAQTRATSKALRGPLGFIVTLAGYSATPAEEMPTSGGDQLGEPERRDVQRTERTDVPAEDVWWLRVKAQMEALKLTSDDLRDAITATGADVPERVGSYKKLITGLNPQRRAMFESWLLEQASQDLPFDTGDPGAPGLGVTTP